MSEDSYWMARAFALAQTAKHQGEVPVGAVVVKDGKLIGEGYNQPIQQHDPSAHAEIIALRNAAQVENNYRLVGTTLYVTLEPCVMCAGALIQARVSRLVYATPDKRAGAAGSVFQILQSAQLNHRVECDSGVMQQACSELLKTFFQARR